MKIWAFTNPFKNDKAYLWLTKVYNWNIGDKVYCNKDGYVQKRKTKYFCGYYFKKGEELSVKDLIEFRWKVERLLKSEISRRDYIYYNG